MRPFTVSGAALFTAAVTSSVPTPIESVESFPVVTFNLLTVTENGGLIELSATPTRPFVRFSPPMDMCIFGAACAAESGLAGAGALSVGKIRLVLGEPFASSAISTSGASSAIAAMPSWDFRCEKSIPFTLSDAKETNGPLTTASVVANLSTRTSPVNTMSGFFASETSMRSFAVALSAPSLMRSITRGARYASKGASDIFDRVIASSPRFCQMFTAPWAPSVPVPCQVSAARMRVAAAVSLAMPSACTESPVIANFAGRPAAESVTLTAKLSRETRDTDQFHAGAGFAAAAGAGAAFESLAANLLRFSVPFAPRTTLTPPPRRSTALTYAECCSGSTSNARDLEAPQQDNAVGHARGS